MTVHQGDCRQVLATLPADTFHAVVTDPPYHLTPGKRSAAGFMGQAWDGGDVAQDPETWAAVLRVARPGAHLVAFGGTRTFHRMMVAIEDAGWELRDTLMWVYGSGFPKGTDKAKIPAGWDGWNTALKPSWEPIILARKPMARTLSANVERWGCGALNVAGCRIGSGSAAGGRWPANLVHDGSPDVLAQFPQDAGAQAPAHRRGGDKFRSTYGAFTGHVDEAGSTFHGDTGSAARFFYCAKATREDRNEGCERLGARALNWSKGDANPGSFQSGGTDRTSPNFHPTVKPTDLMRWLARLVTPPGGRVLDPFTGSGSTAKACALEGFAFTGVELDPAFVEIARAREEHAQRLVAQGAAQPSLV